MTLFSWRPDPKSYAEFLDFVAERPDEERWELVDGEFVMQASPTGDHQRIVANVLSALDSRFARRGVECGAIPGVTIKFDRVDTYAPIPDVVARCGPPLRGSVCSDPVVVVEVLSPSTMAKDRGFKAEFYRIVPTVAAYMIVYADEARVETWRRNAPTDIFEVASGLDAVVNLPEVDQPIPLSDIYARTTLTAR
jgi:Uma2 family endonuclease